VFIWPRQGKALRTVAMNDWGLWFGVKGNYLLRWWWGSEWKRQYNLKPPAPGKCFPCEVEL